MQTPLHDRGEPNRGVGIHVAAAVFALSAFAMAIIVGLVAGVDAATILVRALIASVAAWLVGFAAGWSMQTAGASERLVGEGVLPPDVHDDTDGDGLGADKDG